jgi:hypothetical protein
MAGLRDVAGFRGIAGSRDAVGLRDAVGFQDVASSRDMADLRDVASLRDAVGIAASGRRRDATAPAPLSKAARHGCARGEPSQVAPAKEAAERP